MESQGSQMADFFCPGDLSCNIYKGFFDNRVDFFDYRTSNSLLYLEFTRIDPKMAYLGHFSKFSQQNFSKHTWGPTYRAREGPCTSGNVESFLFWYRSWALVCSAEGPGVEGGPGGTKL